MPLAIPPLVAVRSSHRDSLSDSDRDQHPLKLEMWASVATTLEDDAAVELTAVMSNFMSLPPKAMPGQVRFSVCGSAGDIASALLQAGALRPSRFPSSSRMHGM
jgi:hypothetical protein